MPEFLQLSFSMVIMTHCLMLPWIAYTLTSDLESTPALFLQGESLLMHHTKFYH